MTRNLWLIAAAIGVMPCTLYARESDGFGADETPAVDGQSAVAPQPISPRGVLAPGLVLVANYTGQAAANLSGGISRDAAFTGELLAGFKADMERIAGLSGGSITFLMARRDGKSLSQVAIGNNTSVQEIYGVQTTRVVMASYKQKLANDRIEIEAGRISGNVAFFTSPFYCQFQSNSTCGSPTFTFKQSNFSYWPAASWAAHAKGWITPKIYLHAGVWEANPDNADEGRNVFDFDTRHATGVTIPLEAGYATTLENDRLPRSYRVGLLLDRADYNDPLLDADGGIANVTGRPSAVRHGRSFAYFSFDQALSRRGESDQGLTLFGNAMFATSGRAYETTFLNLALVQKGTFAGRGKDSAGIMLSMQRLSDEAIAAVRAVKPEGHINRTQWIGEVNYSVQIGDMVRVTPNLQYIHDPDQTRFPAREKSIPDAFVVGLKFSITPFPF